MANRNVAIAFNPDFGGVTIRLILNLYLYGMDNIYGSCERGESGEKFFHQDPMRLTTVARTNVLSQSKGIPNDTKGLLCVDGLSHSPGPRLDQTQRLR
ncbi:MAG: hypothetical protein ACD_62C00316G0002 [uncultured bacterium]|nr:MAG: hypothetical protein ACD_62C00316G0002 [uncultured bacterium]